MNQRGIIGGDKKRVKNMKMNKIFDIVAKILLVEANYYNMV